MSRRSKAQSYLRTPKFWLLSFLRVLRFLLCLKKGVHGVDHRLVWGIG
jgi:hypothetical protein